MAETTVEETIPRSSVLCVDLKAKVQASGGIKLAKGSSSKVEDIIEQEGLSTDRPPEKHEVTNKKKNRF
jgi:hypothetical protein